MIACEERCAGHHGKLQTEQQLQARYQSKELTIDNWTLLEITELRIKQAGLYS